MSLPTWSWRAGVRCVLVKARIFCNWEFICKVDELYVKLNIIYVDHQSISVKKCHSTLSAAHLLNLFFPLKQSFSQKGPM